MEDPDPDYIPEEPPEWLEQARPLRLARPGDPPDPKRQHLDLASHIEIRDKTLASLQLVGPVVHVGGSFLRYSDGVFVDLPEHDVYWDVAARDGAPTGDKNKPLKLRHSDCMSVVASLRMGQERAGFFDSATPGIAFRDCFVRLGPELEQLEHSPQFKARYKYDFDREHSAAPLEWLRFLQQVWKDEPDFDERLHCLRQFMGLCICGMATRFQAALVLFGSGSNGKSVIGEVLEACMPDGSVSSIPPQEMGNEYSRAMLAGKLLNLVSELPESDILNNESWKAIISGDPIKARQIRQAPFMFRPIAGHVYSANRLPGTQDHTKGFWRRLIVLTFNRAFEGDDREIGLARRLIDSERAQIVNWAIEGARDVIRDGGYTIPPSSSESVEQWRQSADQVAMFLDEETVRVEETGTERKVLYRQYRAWCDENGHRPLALSKFGARLIGLGVGLEQRGMDARARHYLVRLVAD